MSELRLEGFDTPLRGRRVFVIGSQDSWISQIASLESESLYKGRSILVLQDGTPTILLRRKWDLVIRVKEGFELQMLATYVANAPKPVRILWTGTGEVPRALWQKWVKNDITLVGGSTESNLHADWEAILFPIRCSPDIVEKALGKNAGKIRDHISELAQNGASIAWTSIDEKQGGNLYWYEPLEVTTNLFTKKEAATLLEGISKWLND